MDLRELMDAADDAAYAHNLRYSGQVAVDPRMSNPHNGVDSDLEEHHVLACAPPQVDDQLNAQLAALLGQYRQDNNLNG